MISQDRSTLLLELANQTLNHLDALPDLSYGVLGGDFGAVCFLCELSKSMNDNIDVDALIDQTLRSINMSPPVLSYCNGLSGIGVGLTLLEEAGLIAGVGHSLGAFDRYLSQWFRHLLLKRDIDPLHGALGALQYFTYRCDSSLVQCAEILDRWSDYLLQSLEQTPIGETIGFRSYDKTLPHNLSLSHGLSGLLIITINALENIQIGNVKKNNVNVVLRKLGDYLLANVNTSGQKISCTPSFGIDEQPPYPSRLAWCYGDLGAALALSRLGTYLNEEKYTEAAKLIVRHSSKRRSVADSMIWDRCICHGSSGIYRMFRHFNESLIPGELTETVDFWFDFTYAQAISNPGKWKELFRHYDNPAKRYDIRYNILDGIPGIGMAMLEDSDMLDKLLLIK